MKQFVIFSLSQVTDCIRVSRPRTKPTYVADFIEALPYSILML